jgi:fluoroquinolone transport system ATP-binding protein
MSAPLAVDDRVIRTERFSFSYPGATLPAVSNLTFTVQRHEIFGFLGPSGAGKSTTQNVLIGLLRGYQGSVNVLGRDLDRVENQGRKSGAIILRSLTMPG